ncbi:MAG: chloride channel protein [Prochlorococcaceae cyanobacterium]
MGRRCTDLIGWLGSVLVAGLLIGVAEWPYQWLSEAGFRLQALWPLGGGAPRSPLLAALPLVGTALFMALAWGPLAAGRGGGITGILVLQDNQEQPLQERALASLSLQRQLVRLPLLALTHLAGLSVGTESPSAALGAALLLGLRGRLAPLRTLPPALLAAIGGGAGLGAAFRSPLLGAAYALEELSAQKGFALVTPTLALAGIGTLLHSGVGAPARLTGGQLVGLEPALLPLGAAIVVAASLAGVLLARGLPPLAGMLGAQLRRRPLLTGLGVSLALAALAALSGGLSLNDGSLSLGPALQGEGSIPWWAAVPRLLGPLLSIAIGAPGGLMHDSMSLGAVLVAPWLEGLPPEQRAALVALAAAAAFGATCRTPLFCGLFVFSLQNESNLLPLLLTGSAGGAALSHWLGGITWNESQLHGFRRG